MAKLAWLIVVGAALWVRIALSAQAGAAADPPVQPAVTAASPGVFHVAILRFPQDHVSDATVALSELARAARRETGNLGYDVYRGKDDAQEFYIVEHWASAAALVAHEHSEAFIRFGQGVLGKYATLHDTVTADAFDVVDPAFPRR